jgi:hypothetical protein
MKTTRKTITLSEQQESSKMLALKKAIQEGFDGGISKRSVREIWQEAERRHKA